MFVFIVMYYPPSGIMLDSHFLHNDLCLVYQPECSQNRVFYCMQSFIKQHGFIIFIRGVYICTQTFLKAIGHDYQK